MGKIINIPDQVLQQTTARFVYVDKIVVSLDKEKENPHFDIEDDGEGVDQMFSEEQKGYLLSVLTKRQQQVAILLFDGYPRPDIARNLMPSVCVQAVHQIILRIRKRLNKKAGIKIESRHSKNGHI